MALAASVGAPGKADPLPLAGRASRRLGCARESRVDQERGGSGPDIRRARSPVWLRCVARDRHDATRARIDLPSTGTPSKDRIGIEYTMLLDLSHFLATKRVLEMEPNHRFRFRLHRNGSSFVDRNTVECFISSDGRVAGTVRNLAATAAFIPFEMIIAETQVIALKRLFLESKSSTTDIAITIGYAIEGSPLMIKHFQDPESRGENGVSIECVQCFEAICQNAIKVAESEKGKGNGDRSSNDIGLFVK